jgi:two-component system, OmpR family, response regulator
VDGAGLRRRLPAHDVDLLILDLMLPDDNGLALCQWVREVQPALPLIMLMAQGDPISRVLGLEMGADDYLPKPSPPFVRTRARPCRASACWTSRARPAPR